MNNERREGINSAEKMKKIKDIKNRSLNVLSNDRGDFTVGQMGVVFVTIMIIIGLIAFRENIQEFIDRSAEQVDGWTYN